MIQSHQPVLRVPTSSHERSRDSALVNTNASHASAVRRRNLTVQRSKIQVATSARLKGPSLSSKEQNAVAHARKSVLGSCALPSRLLSVEHARC